MTATVLIVGLLTISLRSGEVPQRQVGSVQGLQDELLVMGPPAPRKLSGLQINESIRLWLRPVKVVDFYTQFTGSRDITRIILDEALAVRVPVNVAFALAWGESRFEPRAVSGRNVYGTRDWGLYQLNDGGRSDWSREDFFDVRKNTHSGLTFLKYCMGTMGSLEMGLAAYNAGVYGVRRWGVPKSTRRHVRAILQYEKRLTEAYNRRFPTFDL
jgi:hypothetical protein